MSSDRPAAEGPGGSREAPRKPVGVDGAGHKAADSPAADSPAADIPAADIPAADSRAADIPAGADILGADRLPDGERLQKVLARAGVGSRRVCEDLIAERRVTVNGDVANLGRRVDPDRDEVEVDGVLVAVAQDLVHYLLNKPRGVVATASDPQGRPTVVSLVPPYPRVFPVGRLDADTEGLLLITNDGQLTYRLTHPKFGVDKEYVAQVVGEPSAGTLRNLRRGVVLDDGPTAPAKVALLAPSVLRIVIHEGRNRQVRRMCDAVGHPVVRLVRTRIGPLADRRLSPGQWRNLEADEVRALASAEAGVPAGRPGAKR